MSELGGILVLIGGFLTVGQIFWSVFKMSYDPYKPENEGLQKLTMLLGVFLIFLGWLVIAL